MEPEKNIPMIKAENLGKKYKIGRVKKGQGSIREVISQIITMPFRKLSGFDSPTESHSNVWALKNVSFEVNQGEVLGIIGANGAGKSTMLKVLARVTPPTTGWAQIRGKLASLLEVGTGFHPELTGRENIMLNGAILGMKRAEIQAKFENIVSFAEIDRFVDTPVKRYSSGMYVRLAFAVAAHLDPDILLVDEILAVGDEAFKRKCLGHMQDASRAGRTVLFVSHNMASIRSLCSKAILLENGMLTTQGSAQDVTDAYLKTRTGDQTVRQWPDQDANQPAMPLSMSLVDENKKPHRTCTTQSKIGFDLVLQLVQPTRFSVCIKVHSVDGTVLFTLARTIPNESDQVPIDEGFEPGKYHMTAFVDSPQLNEGSYFASLTIEQALLGRFFHEERVIEWTVTDYTSETSRPRRKAGLVQPKSQWQMNKYTDAD